MNNKSKLKQSPKDDDFYKTIRPNSPLVVFDRSKKSKSKNPM